MAQVATKDRIEEAALQLFHDHGYTGTTVRDLTEACSLTPGSLYNHFPSKDDLLFDIVDRMHDMADEVLADALRDAPPDPAGRLEALAAAFTGFHIEHPRRTRIANRDYIHLPEPQREHIIARRRHIRSVFADALRDGLQAGVFAFEDDDALIAASMAILNMAVSVAEWFDESGPRTQQEMAAVHGRLALRIARATG